MRESLHLFGETSNAKHTVFVDTKEEAQNFTPEEYFDTVPELVDKPHRRLRKAQLQEPVVVAGARTKLEIEKVEKATAEKYRELHARLERRDKLAKWEEKLKLKRKLMVRPEPLPLTCRIYTIVFRTHQTHSVVR